MIKNVKYIYDSKSNYKFIRINRDNVIKYIGQSGTSGYASAAKGYLADYILRSVPVSWTPLCFDNSKNDRRYYVDALAESVINREYQQYNKLIIHSTPDIWSKYIGQYSDISDIVGYCTWETNKLPKKWVECINLVPDVWVPSNFNKDCFLNSGVKSNVTVVPHIWHKQSLFKKSEIKLHDYCGNDIPNDKYTFYCIGELNFRKGINDLVKVFDKIHDQYPDTQLILKVHYKEYNTSNRQYCISELSKLTNKIGKAVYLILDNLTNEEVLALHSFGDCYVSLNKGEGFGLTIFDAFNYKKQVITTGYGGQVDFLGINHNGLVNFKIDKVKGMDKFSTNYSVDQEWGYPDLDHAYSLMEKML